MWKHLNDQTPTARKQHTCELCGLPIPRATRYIRRSGITDHGPTSFAMHQTCERLTHDWDEWDWECTDLSSFRDHLAETHHDRVTDASQP